MLTRSNRARKPCCMQCIPRSRLLLLRAEESLTRIICHRRPCYTRSFRVVIALHYYQYVCLPSLCIYSTSPNTVTYGPLTLANQSFFIAHVFAALSTYTARPETVLESVRKKCYHAGHARSHKKRLEWIDSWGSYLPVFKAGLTNGRVHPISHIMLDYNSLQWVHINYWRWGYKYHTNENNAIIQIDRLATLHWTRARVRVPRPDSLSSTLLFHGQIKDLFPSRTHDITFVLHFLFARCSKDH